MAAKYLTPEQKHGMNCQPLREKSEEYLRKAFHKTFPRPPADLYKELKKHDVALRKLLQRGILNQKQYDLLFPQSKQTDSSKFDTTLLFLLLRYFGGYKAPLTGWNNEPGQNDRSEVANLIRLKIGRNQIQHLPPSITNAEYKGIYLYLRQPLLDLGCPLNDICRTRSFKYDNQPVIGSFIGREGELDKIHQVINNNQRIHGVVIAGIPGVGKTELARKYCEQHEQDFEHIIWINCDSIKNSFQNIAQSLKLDCLQNQGFKDLKVIAKLISEYFKNEKVLYVFDNCINGSVELVDVLSPQHHNIITSQIKSWGQDYALFELEVWPKKIAFDFLKNNLNQEKDLFGQLIDEFNCHPLALQHAVAFIKETGLSLKEYLELLSEHKLDVLSEKVALRHGVTKSVFSSFHITLDRIKAKYPRIYEFVSIFAVLEISFVKEEFLERYFATRFDFIKPIKILIKFNLIKIFGKDKTKFYTMHSLYQCSIQINQKQNEEKILNTIFKMIRKWKYSDENHRIINEYKEASVWFYQFQYIWYHQHHLRKAILHEISTDVSYIIDCLSICTSATYQREVLEELYLEWKERTNDINLYIIKYHMVIIDRDGNKLDNRKNILIEVERNVSSPSPEKVRLLEIIKRQLADDSEDFGNSYHEGYFHDVIDGLIDFPYMKALIFKEWKQYDQALEIFCQYKELKNQMMNVKLEIACCYILQGNIEEGLILADDAEDEIYSYRSPLEVGRALFDAGCYQQSTNYLKQFVREFENCKASETFCFQVLDGFSKLVVQNCCIERVLVSRMIGGKNFQFRADTIRLICLIRLSEYTRAFEMVEYLLQKQPEKQCLRLWFREGLLIGKHLMRRHEYYQALLIYQIIQRFQNELEIPAPEIDVQQCINICLYCWSKIFHI